MRCRAIWENVAQAGSELARDLIMKTKLIEDIISHYDEA